MDNEGNPFTLGNTDFKHSSALICTDEHRDVAEVEHSDWIPVRMQYVLIFDPVLASTVQTHGIHAIKIT